MMIPRSELPEDAADWNGIEVSFPRLVEDTAESCPTTANEILEYVRMESADTDDADESRLSVVRTARVGDVNYWLWTYTESDGELCYVLFQQNPGGSTVLGLAETNGLSPEQYLLADYYDEVYWS